MTFPPQPSFPASAADTLLGGRYLTNWNVENGYASGVYYPGVAMAFATAISGQNTTASHAYFVPFIPTADHTFTGISIYNSSTADGGENIRLGIYDSLNGRPANLITDAGTVTLPTTVAVNDATANCPTEKGKLYYIALLGDSVSTIATLTTNTNLSYNNAGAYRGDLGFETNPAVTVANFLPLLYAATMAFGAFPATSPTVYETQIAATPQFFNPMMIG